VTAPITDERKAALLAVSAAFAAQRFSGGQRGRVSKRGAVHDVAWVDWFGVDVPAPACHVGTAGYDFTRLQPTTDAVTCKRCQRGNAARAAPIIEPRGAQLLLDLDALPSPEHEAPGLPGEDHSTAAEYHLPA
jgi:hypothetical protein